VHEKDMSQTPVDTLEALETMVSSQTTVRQQRVIRPHFLEQEEGIGAPRQFILDAESLVLGRVDDADICIEHPKASRRHAIISRRSGEYTIRDNESRNGIYLNGLKVHSAVLRDGDIIQVTDCVFVYHER
jgi:pSer/pThr/pTyr-binding forkhead associated (FHA) protein